ncbi:MAG: response regulator [Lentisphaerae bacterium]|nr:response regulator [Lentisphaerota bacterium]
MAAPEEGGADVADVGAPPLAPAAGQTVRIATAKLDTLLTRSEELLRVRMASEQRASQARELRRVTDDWARRLRQNGRFRELGAASASGGSAADSDVGVGGKDSYFGVFQDSVDRLCRAMADDRRLVDSLVDQLLEHAKSVMMLPFATITRSLPRQARSIANDLGKQVRCEVVGDHLDIDKRILEEFHEVLIHLLRNAVDHGIEMPEQRTVAGKPVQGEVTLSITQQSGNSVEISVEDDGAGIDTGKLRGVALKSGVVSEGDLSEDTDQELLPLIFESGVSTSPILSKLSGRGLGMAIVRERVEGLGGSISVATAAGQGTRFSVVLPTMLSTYRGVHMKAAGQSFVVSTSGLDRVMRVRRDGIRTVANRETVQTEGGPLAFAPLADLLGLRCKRTTTSEWLSIVVVAGAGQRLALGVDEIVGEEEILAKSLGSQLRRVRNINAATVLASGKIVLVLNVSDLIRSAGGLGRAVPQSDGPAGGSSEREPSRILLVEDSITARVLLQSILEPAGYTVTTAVDGVEAFASLRSEVFDLVVSDVEMPRMNGFELTHRIRGEERLNDLPVVLVTARETREDRERGIDAGANAYLGKSNFDQTDLLQAIERLI